MIDTLFFLDKLVLSKITTLITPYKIFTGVVLTYLVVACCVQSKNNKRKVK